MSVDLHSIAPEQLVLDISDVISPTCDVAEAYSVD